ncbi:MULTISPECIES: hypothetical protein [Serratia]|uniref:hypothetical protein n=1 Tax=Serratia TaxID=613 RepID=UPI0011DA2C57|nr:MULTISPECIES: hypothetical protein [Serratia]QJU39048.1 hypothetical protein HMI62_06805 [Serratia marcescens]TXE57008.1 hypothetical protein FOT58_19825 [Serratia nematodiphila]
MIAGALLKNWRLGVGAALVAALAICLWSVSYYSERAERAEGRARQLQADNSLQGETIATQTLQFNRMNQIAGAVAGYQMAVGLKSEEAQNEIRTIVKRDPAGRQCVDPVVAQRVLDYANRLRSSAVPGLAAGTIPTNTAAPAAGCRLTYGQAVLWIDPLLAALDKANNQLRAIQRLDGERRK